MATHHRGADAAGDVGIELVVMLREGRGHAELYDAMAPVLYRYCWSLLGTRHSADDPRGAARLTSGCDDAGEAVGEALLAAVDRLDRLGDRSHFRAWLFALARAACQRRGLAAQCPYTDLATSDAERPFVEALSRLPRSHRDLAELYLRHQLSTFQIALIVGLDVDTTGQLCQAAITRMAEALAELGAMPAHSEAAEWQMADIAALFDLVTPPLPPPELRDHAVPAAGDPASAVTRRRAAERLEPLGSDGFPLHWDRSPHGSSDAEPRSVERPHDGDGPTDVPRIGHEDETGTSHGSEQVADLLPETGEERGAAPRRSRWTAPAFAGMITVVLALALSSASTMFADGPVGNTVTETDSPATPSMRTNFPDNDRRASQTVPVPPRSTDPGPVARESDEVTAPSSSEEGTEEERVVTHPSDAPSASPEEGPMPSEEDTPPSPEEPTPTDPEFSENLPEFFEDLRELLRM